MAWANGRRPASARGAATRSRCWANCTFRIRSGCCIPRSPTSPGFKVNSGRIQADGPGALRRAEIRGRHPARADRSEGGRLVPAQHAVFQLRRRADDDERAVRPTLRRAAAQAGIQADPTRHGPGAFDPGRDRGDHVPHGAACAAGDRAEEPLPGRRRGAELRGQRTHSARRHFRQHLDSARGRRRGRRARRGAVRLAPVPRQPAHGGRRARFPARLLSGPGIFSATKSARILTTQQHSVHRTERRGAAGEDRGPDQGGESHRLVSRADGVWPARAGRTLHHRRRAIARRCRR